MLTACGQNSCRAHRDSLSLLCSAWGFSWVGLTGGIILLELHTQGFSPSAHGILCFWNTQDGSFTHLSGSWARYWLVSHPPHPHFLSVSTCPHMTSRNPSSLKDHSVFIFHFHLLSLQYTFYTPVLETFLNAEMITFPSHVYSCSDAHQNPLGVTSTAP